MDAPFNIAPPDRPLRLTAGQAGQFAFVVRHAGTEGRTARLSVRATAPASDAWFAVATPTVAFDPSDERMVEVRVVLPDDVGADTYAVRLVVADVNDPSVTWGESPKAHVQVGAPARRGSWLPWAAALAVVAILAVVAVRYPDQIPVPDLGGAPEVVLPEAPPPEPGITGAEAAVAPVEVGTEAVRVFRGLWRRLPESSDTCGLVDDPFPNGGLRSFGCHARSLMTFVALEALAPVPIFTDGPHDGRLDLEAETFGRYNPAFVTWAGQVMVPAAEDPAFRAASQPIYDAHVRRLARLHHLVAEKLFDPSQPCLEREQAWYEPGVEPRDPYRRWASFFDLTYCGIDYPPPRDPVIDDAAAVFPVVGFWLRRSLDGTDDEFRAALERLLRAYDAAWLAEQAAER